MKLIFIRHGQSVGNTKAGFISGRSDPDGLSQLGRTQIARTAYELRTLKFDSILTSPVVRAQESARILNLQFNTKVKTAEWLTELHHGIFEGNFWWEIIHKIPTSWRRNREDFHTAYPGGGESVANIMKRVSEGIKDFLSNHPTNKNYLFVTHEAVITALRYCILHGFIESIKSDLDEKKATKFFHNTRLPNAGYVALEIRGDVMKITNVVAKLPAVSESGQSVKLYSQAIIPDSKIKLEKINTASNNSVYHISAKPPYLLKIYHTEDKSIIKKQLALYDYLSSQKIAAPRIKFYDGEGAFFKGDVIIQDYLEGVSLDYCLSNHPKNINKILLVVQQELAKIHKLNKNEVSTFWLSPVAKQFRPWKPYMVSNINMTLHMLPELGVDLDKRNEIVKTLTVLKDYISSDKYGLIPIHGDLASGNIIINHNKVSCQYVRLIDFEWSRLGDPLWDYAYFWGWLERKDAGVAKLWRKLIAETLADDQLESLNRYRVLFHAWTVRDMIDYKGDSFRKRRGEKSRSILLSG